MTRFLVVLLAALGFAAGAAQSPAQDARPAGYIMAYELKGADAEKGTVVVRKGVELRPKLLMPVYDGDSVFVRDETSRITLNLAREGDLVVSGKLRRKDIAGEMASGESQFHRYGASPAAGCGCSWTRCPVRRSKRQMTPYCRTPYTMFGSVGSTFTWKPSPP